MRSKLGKVNTRRLRKPPFAAGAGLLVTAAAAAVAAAR
jgi:hypothetical protein